MKPIVFGASQGVGRPLIELALAQGHQVSAVVRNPSSLDLNHALLNVVAGDGTNAASVEQSLKGSGVFIEHGLQFGNWRDAQLRALFPNVDFSYNQAHIIDSQVHT